MRFTALLVAAAATVSYAQNLGDLIGGLATNSDLMGIASSLATDPGFQSVASEILTATGTDILTNSIVQSIYSEIQTNSVFQSVSSALETNSDFNSVLSSVSGEVSDATATGASQTASGTNPISTGDSGADRVALGAMGVAAAGVLGVAALL